MHFSFKMHVLAYLLSLSAPMQTGLNILKSMNTTTVPDVHESPNPTPVLYNVHNIENVRDELSRPRHLDNRSRDRDGHLHRRFRKVQDFDLERNKNRTRKQRKISNSTTPYSASENTDENATRSNMALERSHIPQHNNNNNNTHLDISNMGGNGRDSKPHSLHPTTTTVKKTTTVSHDTTTYRTMKMMSSHNKKSMSRRERRLLLKARRQHKAASESRSKNRPQRHRRKKHRHLHRHLHKSASVSQQISEGISPLLDANEKTNQNRSNEESLLTSNLANNSTSADGINTTSLSDNQNVTTGPVSKDDCPNCAKNGLSEDKVKEIRREMFINTLTDKLRVNRSDLNSHSNGASNFPLPSVLLEEAMQDNAMNWNFDRFHAQDQKVVLPGKDLGSHNCLGVTSTGCYSFTMDKTIKGDVASAELWVYKTPDRNDSGIQTFSIYGLDKDRHGLRGAEKVRAKNQIQRHDTNVREGWVIINITRTVASWVRQRTAKEMIAIRCSTCVTRNHKALFGNKEGYKPLIIIKYDKTTVQDRERRSSESCDPDNECCKRSLSVNFYDIHMHDVTAPPDLLVHYCYGTCNSFHSNHNNHTMIKQRYRDLRDDTSMEMRDRLRPCCVPISYIGTQLFIRSSRATKLIYVPNLIVDRCGCV